MNIAIRLFLGYFLIVGLAAWFVLGFFSREVEPGVRQGTEDTLVDTANLLAEIVAPQVAYGSIGYGDFTRAVAAARMREPHANIHGNEKYTIDFRLYITDAKGIVIFDSEFKDTGADYSRWRDVTLALRGQYGARSTRENEQDPRSSIMYIAAPIVHEDQLVGVLSLGKPTRSVEIYADIARQRVRDLGLILLVSSGLIGLLFTAWLTHSLNRIQRYAKDVTAGRKSSIPTGGGKQISDLARALGDMREKLDGKQYVESYVQSLTHEMKSPLTAIRGSAELLVDAPQEDRQRFAGNIVEQTERMQLIIDRLLALARIEQLQEPAESGVMTTIDLIHAVMQSRQTQLQAKSLKISLTNDTQTPQYLEGDLFLLQQAIGNLLDNAIDFSPSHGEIHIQLSESPDRQQQTISIIDQGSGIPDYALPQIFDRFYSLPRPATGKKSTGLGLAFVREVLRIHNGQVQLFNRQGGGVHAQIELPNILK